MSWEASRSRRIAARTMMMIAAVNKKSGLVSLSSVKWWSANDQNILHACKKTYLTTSDTGSILFSSSIISYHSSSIIFHHSRTISSCKFSSTVYSFHLFTHSNLWVAENLHAWQKMPMFIGVLVNQEIKRRNKTKVKTNYKFFASASHNADLLLCYGSLLALIGRFITCY